MKLKSSTSTAIAIMAAGAVIFLLSFLVQSHIVNTYKSYLPYKSLGDNIKNRTTKGHLWFEEFMSGDRSINIQTDVLDLFQNSKFILEGALNHEETELGFFEDLQNDSITTTLERVVANLDEIIVITDMRIQMREMNSATAFEDSIFVMMVSMDEQAGGELDQSFDEKYKEIQASLDELVININASIAEEMRKVNIISKVVFVTIVLIFGWLSFYVYRIHRRNEISSQENKSKLTEELEKIDKMTDFIQSVSKGNFSNSLDINTDQDKLAHALVEMKSILKSNAENEEERNWQNRGLNQISEILRSGHNSLEDLSRSILLELVKYLEINQGSVFVTDIDNEGNPIMKLAACYAWDRLKSNQQYIHKGEGLIGEAWLEGEVIHLTEIPEQYIEISSSLGASNPTTIFIQPLIMNDEVCGVLEIATFKKLEEKHKSFLNQLGEIIASVISSVSINDRTQRLLQEAQQRAEELKATEEELRQNQEELEATQEEMNRQKAELEEELAQLKGQLALAEASEGMEETNITINKKSKDKVNISIPEGNQNN